MHHEDAKELAAEVALEVEYHGGDLEALFTLKRYRQWILDSFRPHLRGRIAEIGAGIGSYSEELYAHADHLDLIEPAPRPAMLLEQRIGGRDRVRLLRTTAERWVDDTAPGSYDCVVMINVLEHIEDDRAMVEGVLRALAPGGHFLVFVPAMMALMSDFDRKYGHFRRYGLNTMTRLFRGAGFDVADVRYFDLLGTLPWLVMNTWLGKTNLKPGLAGLYDRVGVPLTRTLESVVRPPFGKNVVMVARKLG